MKIEQKNPPRIFKVGLRGDIAIQDCGDIYLADNQQLTFRLPGGGEVDVTAKPWGLYACGSVNDRLPRHGVKVALVKNSKQQFYVMLVEDKQVDAFLQYLESDKNVLVGWLSDTDFAGQIAQQADAATIDDLPHCPSGSTAVYEKVFTYDKRPEGETAFDFGDVEYYREFWRSTLTGHMVARHQLPLQELYEKDYVQSTYGGDLKTKFDKIVNLPAGKSDNKARVQRIVDFMDAKNLQTKNAMDIGSGLCVFLHELQQHGWRGFAVDMDDAQIEHAKSIGVDAKKIDINGSYLDLQSKFQLVALNKVIEHVIDPVQMLKSAKQFLADDGYMYVEVPDAEMAAKHGPIREEFFIEHYHAYSVSSLALTAEKAGLQVETITRLHEPSDKYTLYGFLRT